MFLTYYLHRLYIYNRNKLKEQNICMYNYLQLKNSDDINHINSFGLKQESTDYTCL